MRTLSTATARGASRSPRLLLLAGLTVAGCLLPTTARAELHLAFGTRWQPLRYTTALFPNAGADERSNNGLNGFQSTSLDPYFALFFAQKYGALLSLDIGYGKNSAQTTTNTGMSSSTTAANNSFFQFGLALGFKWYVTQPRASRVTPYLYADFFKYFASITTDKMITGDQASFQASAASPIGASFAFGAEYFVSPSFSVGSEVLGLRVSNTSGDLNIPSGAGSTIRSQSYTSLTFYTGISLNYRFQLAAKVSASEEEGGGGEEEKSEAPKPKKRKVKQNPEDGETTTPTPPPTPESVD